MNRNDSILSRIFTTYGAVSFVAMATVLSAGCGGGEGSASAEVAAPETLAQSAQVAQSGAETTLELDAPQAAPEVVARLEPAAPEPSPELGAHAGVTVRRMAVTRTIEGREPVDGGTTFVASHDKLYAFVDIRNEGDELEIVHVTFERPDGRTTGHVELDIPANVGRWRTWAFTRHAQMPGDWVAVLATDDGVVIGRVPFSVEG